MSMPRIWLLLSSFSLASIVMFYDFVAFGRLPITKWPVDLSLVGLLRSATIAVAAYLLVQAVRPHGIEQNWRSPLKYFRSFRLESALTLTFFVMTGLMVVWNPELLQKLQYEDEIIETLSCTMLLLAAILMFSTLYTKRFHNTNFTIRQLSLPISIGILFLLISLEEISWGQRIIGFETPEAFSQNLQGEFNLHNFDSWLAENLYYATALCAFVLLPYAAAGARRQWHPLAAIFIPMPAFALIAAPVAFTQAEMWNNVPVQIAAWGTTFILLDIARITKDKTRYYTLLILTICVIGQAIFLVETGLFNALTEYKETMIAFLCLAYATGVINRHYPDEL